MKKIVLLSMLFPSNALACFISKEQRITESISFLILTALFIICTISIISLIIIKKNTKDKDAKRKLKTFISMLLLLLVAIPILLIIFAGNLSCTGFSLQFS